MVGRATFGRPWMFKEMRDMLDGRRHLAASPIFKGIPDFRQTRIAMLRATTVEELTGIMEEVREKLNAH